MIVRMRLPVALSLLVAACQAGAAPAPKAPVLPASQVAPAQTPAPAQAADLLDVRLSPVLEGDKLTALAVELRFLGDVDGSTSLLLPEQWAGARELWKHLEDVQVEGASSVEAVAEGKPALRVIRAAPHAPLVVRYRVRSAYAEDPDTRVGQPFAPIVRPTWFYAFGSSLFPIIEDREDLPVHFAWQGPAGFPFASDLEHFDAAKGGTVDALIESIVIGGSAVKVHQLEGADHAGLRIAVAGEYGFSSDAFFELAKAVMVTERAFFGERTQKFLIAMSPLAVFAGGRSIGGSGLADAFVLSVARNAQLPELRHLLAHEYFHSWNPARLGGPITEETDMTGKWFGEGFTELYAFRMMLRSGIGGLEDFVASWNEILLAYATSPVRNAPAARVAAEYWSNGDISKLPYRRGQLLAALWERNLREVTRGARTLDDVLRAMAARAAATADQSTLPPAAALFPLIYAELGGPSIADDVERYLTRGETIELPADTFGPCLRVVKRTQPTFERGWDPEATSTNDNHLTGLRVGSPAYRAGLREGMKIIERVSGLPGDSSVRYVMRMHDGKRERTFSFFPRGTGTVAFQRLEIAARTPEARAACVRELAGKP